METSLGLMYVIVSNAEFEGDCLSAFKDCAPFFGVFMVWELVVGLPSRTSL
jgi:hypothetical protein